MGTETIRIAKKKYLENSFPEECGFRLDLRQNTIKSTSDPCPQLNRGFLGPMLRAYIYIQMVTRHFDG